MSINFSEQMLHPLDSDPTYGELMGTVNHLHHELKLALHEKRLLYSTNATIELDSLLGLLGKEIEFLKLFDAYMIDLADEAFENLVCVKMRMPQKFKDLEKTYKNFNFSMKGDFINVHAFKENCTKIVNVDDIGCYEHYVQVRFKRWEIFESITVPLINPSNLQPIGTITAYCLEDFISSEAEDNLKRISDIFGQSLVNAQKYDRLKSRELYVGKVAAEQKRFMDFVTLINSLTSREKIFQTVTQELLQRLPFDHISIFMQVDDKLHCTKSNARETLNKDLYKEFDNYTQNIKYEVNETDSAVSVCFIKNNYFIVEDAMKIRHLPMSKKDRDALATLETPHTLFFMPIRISDQAIGVFRLISLSRVVEVSEKDIQFMDLLSRFIGTAIRSVTSYEFIEMQKQEIELLNSNLQHRIEELAELATHDKLTGLHNFRSFEMELERIMEGQGSWKYFDLALIVVDIDHFKQFNDVYGHKAGNEALANVANKISLLTRENDVACRYGGEEFVIILPNCDLDGARRFAERVRKSVEESFVSSEAGQLNVTVSVGFGCRRPEEDKESMFNRIDKALYKAKNAGRNRVEIAE